MHKKKKKNILTGPGGYAIYDHDHWVSSGGSVTTKKLLDKPIETIVKYELNNNFKSGELIRLESEGSKGYVEFKTLLPFYETMVNVSGYNTPYYYKRLFKFLGINDVFTNESLGVRFLVNTYGFDTFEKPPYDRGPIEYPIFYEMDNPDPDVILPKSIAPLDTDELDISSNIISDPVGDSGSEGSIGGFAKGVRIITILSPDAILNSKDFKFPVKPYVEKGQEPFFDIYKEIINSSSENMSSDLIKFIEGQIKGDKSNSWNNGKSSLPFYGIGVTKASKELYESTGYDIPTSNPYKNDINQTFKDIVASDFPYGYNRYLYKNQPVVQWKLIKGTPRIEVRAKNDDKSNNHPSHGGSVFIKKPVFETVTPAIKDNKSEKVEQVKPVEQTKPNNAEKQVEITPNGQETSKDITVRTRDQKQTRSQGQTALSQKQKQFVENKQMINKDIPKTGSTGNPFAAFALLLSGLFALKPKKN